jgi:DNA replication and repair protein RecF
MLLKLGSYDEAWMLILEKNLSKIAVEIIINRKKIIEKINYISQNSKFNFPRIYLALISECDNLQCKDDELLDIIISKYQKYRKQDIDSGQSNFGPHKTELLATHIEEKILASTGSMGQQKAVLVSIILFQVLAIIEETKKLPIVLLDEVFSHLDRKRSIYLSEFLLNLGIQIWITDTETQHIDFFADSANLLKL